jgi:hypothetical protein
MFRTRIRKGDLFAVPLEVNAKKYFQYVADDLTQLNSAVIRAFRTAYPIDVEPSLVEVAKDQAAFQAHLAITRGLKLKLWQKVGHASCPARIDLLFRDTNDFGNGVETSDNWFIWRIGEAFQHVGALEGDHRKAEIGIVVTPKDIVDRMRTGKYNFVYPGFC